jgi:hypothetical protein
MLSIIAWILLMIIWISILCRRYMDNKGHLSVEHSYKWGVYNFTASIVVSLLVLYNLIMVFMN